MTFPPPAMFQPQQPRPGRKALWITLGGGGGVVALVFLAVVAVVAVTSLTSLAGARWPDAAGTSSSRVEIRNTTVSVVGQTVTSKCFTFTLLKGYKISPYSASCSTEIRVDQGNGSPGDSLGGYTIGAQINMTKDTFLPISARKVGVTFTQTRHVTVDGSDSIMAYYELEGLTHSVTFVPIGKTAYASHGQGHVPLSRSARSRMHVVPRLQLLGWPLFSSPISQS